MRQDEPVFHASWEGRVYALNRAMRAWRKWSHRHRQTRDRTPCPRRLSANELLRAVAEPARYPVVVKYGFVTQEEMESGKPAPGSTKATPALDAGHVCRLVEPRHTCQSTIRTSGRRSRWASAFAPATSIPRAILACPAMREAKRASCSVTTESSCFPTRTHISRVRSRSTCIPYASPRVSCGASSASPRDSVYLDMWDDYLERSLILCWTPVSLAALPRLPRDDGGPVFAEPWQANAFALAVRLSEQGHFTWKEWASALADTLRAAADRGEPDDGSRYYDHWLATLERLVMAKGLTDQETLVARKEAWIEAYRNTPHGKPVELPRSQAKPDKRWILPGLASAFAGYWIIQHANAGSPWGMGCDPARRTCRECRLRLAARRTARTGAGSSRGCGDAHDGRA